MFKSDFFKMLENVYSFENYQIYYCMLTIILPLQLLFNDFFGLYLTSFIVSNIIVNSGYNL